jgi:hypothetical protein
MSTNEINIEAVNARAKEEQTPMTNQTIEQAVEEIEEGIRINFGSLNHQVCLRAITIDDMLEYILPKVTKALQAQRDAGYQQCLLEIKHEQRKLLDGFGHPKDCAMCLTPPTK